VSSVGSASYDDAEIWKGKVDEALSNGLDSCQAREREERIIDCQGSFLELGFDVFVDERPNDQQKRYAEQVEDEYHSLDWKYSFL